MRLLVTGGTGFIGSHLAEEGRRLGAEVVVLGLTDRPEEQANVELLRRQGVEVLRAASPTPSCAGGRCGAPPTSSISRWRCGRARKSDEFFESINLDGTRASARGLQRARVERFVYCSTIGIYGHRAPGITREDSPLAPGNIYERTKVSAERLVREVRGEALAAVVILRPADVYGPRDQRLLKLFKGVRGGRFPLFGAGEGRRHMVYVDDVVSGFFRACERDGRARGRVIVAGPKACTLRELVEEVRRRPAASATASGCRSRRCWASRRWWRTSARRLGVEPPIYRRRMDFFCSDSEFDTSRARQVLDWAPEVDLPEGIRRTLEDYRRAGLSAA